MANSNIAHWFSSGKYNGGNARTSNAVDNGALPWAFTPSLGFDHTITWQDLARATGVQQSDVMTIAGTVVFGTASIAFTDARTGALITTVSTTVHEDTITIGGTASDGNYETFFPTPNGVVRVRTVRSTTPATNSNIATQHAADITDLIATSLAGVVTSATANAAVVTVVYAAGISPVDLTTNETTATGTITASASATTTTIAAALEALIQTARATTLADYLTDETTSTNTITVTYDPGVQVSMVGTMPGAMTATVATTNVATIPMGRTGDWFPTNVAVDGGFIFRKAAFAGGTPTITITVGDANDVDGLVTSTSIATTGGAETIAAAEFAEHFEAAFVPLATITSNQLFTSLTAGEVSCVVRYAAPPTI